MSEFSRYFKSRNFSKQQIHDLKIMVISMYCGHYSFSIIQVADLINTMLTYEWNHSLDDVASISLEVILISIACCSELFPVTLKLEHLLRQLQSIMSTPLYLHIGYNDQLVDLCVDIGLFIVTETKGIYYTGSGCTIVRKGVLDYVYKPDKMLFLYIQSVMITI